jgi:hypothetical protein
VIGVAKTHHLGGLTYKFFYFRHILGLHYKEEVVEEWATNQRGHDEGLNHLNQ